MPNLLIRLLFFVGSYFPLAVIFFFLLLRQHFQAAIIILVVGIVGLIGMALYLRLIKSIAPMTVTIEKVQRRDREAISYIFSYIVPFLAVPFQEWERGVALGIFFFVVAILYVTSNMIQINPMLNLAGYHLYEISLKDGGVHFLLTRRDAIRSSTIKVAKAGSDILIEHHHDD